MKLYKSYLIIQINFITNYGLEQGEKFEVKVGRQTKYTGNCNFIPVEKLLLIA